MERQFKLNFEKPQNTQEKKEKEKGESLFGLDEEILTELDKDDHLDQYKDRR